jgi:hypothetical protein
MERIMSRKKQHETVASVWGLRCPHCGRDDRIEVEVRGWATISVDGTNAESDHTWDDTSGCMCAACDYIGSVAHFMIDNQKARRSGNYPKFVVRNQRGAS